jgi:hypothetical protein
MSISVKARLRIVVVALMVAVVSALSALNIHSLVQATFDDALQRAQMNAQQVKSFVIQRVREQTAEWTPRPGNLEEVKKVWIEIVSQDRELGLLLQDTVASSRTIVEISVAGEGGGILASSNPTRVGENSYKLPDLDAWAKKSAWRKLQNVLFQRQDFELAIPLGGPDQKPVLAIKVVVSSVLLRAMVWPQVRNIGLILLGSLLASALLAVVVSNLALRPLDSISRAIDRISRGEFGKPVALAEGGAKEFSAVQSKLNLLGQQFRGAREDATQLRSNIERLLEKLEEVVLLFDRDDRLVMAGRAAERLLGRGRWEMVGRSLAELFPPSTALGGAVESALQLRQPLRDHPLTLERDGLPAARVLVSVETLEGFPKKERMGTLVTLRDAETRREIQSHLDLSARLAAISRLTEGVAHEIKNPLNAIAVHLEVLRSKLADSSEVDPQIQTIAREIIRLDRVVKTFLDFTRPLDLKMRELDLVALAREVAGLVGPSAERQHVQIELEAEPAEVFLHGDRDLLQQVILNVVVNGVEAMRDGGRLRIQVRQQGGECVLAVSDEGAGIPPEIRDKIFNLYFSTKGKGSGIGLAMTFRVVQLHNGTIDFTSAPGAGTTFRLRFPSIDTRGLPGSPQG